MSEKKDVQTQHDLWGRVFEAPLGWMGEGAKELQRFEGAWLEETTNAIDQTAHLVKESFTQAAKLGAEWRRIGMEAARRTGELWQPRS
ncbi:MAG: hypothetical protein HYY06_02665 [Deltaproteobacteria bacterium]|nr:hypothetical protein [Deltaproteobacteria bacterium]